MKPIVSSIIIIAGAFVMLASILRSRDLLQVAPLIGERHRGTIMGLLRVHRALMSFFLMGYIIVAFAFLYESRFVGELFVAIIFLFGAAFVLMGIVIQSKMLGELQSTIHGIVPICSRCRKIRVDDSEPENRDGWKTIEFYLAERTDADVARAFCPDCMDKLYGLPKETGAEE